jgi:hypothetical protein
MPLRLPSNENPPPFVNEIPVIAPYEEGDAPVRDEEGTPRLDDTLREFGLAGCGTACGGGGSILVRRFWAVGMGGG